MIKWLVLGIAVIMYGFVIAFPHKKAWITIIAAVLVLFTGTVTPLEAFGTFINWNVLLIYVGSLIIAELFIYSRVPAALADKIVEKSPNIGIGIVFILVMTGLISAFVENVATVLVMAPIAIALCRKLKINPTWFMIGLAVMANLQGTATLVGDPPSMIFASTAGYNFNDFFFHQGRPSIFFAVQIGGIAGAIYFYFYFKKLGKIDIDLPQEKIVSFVPSILLLALIVGLALISFFFEGFSLLSGALCFALGIIGLLWYMFIRKEPYAKTKELVKGLDWETIVFLIGIFVVIGGITNTGLLSDLAGVLSGIIGNNMLLGFIVIVLISVIISGFVDNVPYIIAMLPVAAILANTMQVPKELFMFGLLIGSCMGGNLTPFGASANIVAMGIVKKEGYKVSFLDWCKIGIPFTLLTTGISSLFIYFVWR